MESGRYAKSLEFVTGVIATYVTTLASFIKLNNKIKNKSEVSSKFKNDPFMLEKFKHGAAHLDS